MSLFYKTGNLIEAAEPIIIHGCNAQGVMGSGVAKAVKDAYPEAYEAYLEAYRTEGLKLGDVIWWFDAHMDIETDPITTMFRFVGNAITQQNYGRDGRRYVDYDAVAVAFESVRVMIETSTGIRGEIPDGWSPEVPMVAIPRIGAGLGGGDWGIISAIIEAAMGNHHVMVYDLP